MFLCLKNPIRALVIIFVILIFSTILVEGVTDNKKEDGVNDLFMPSSNGYFAKQRAYSGMAVPVTEMTITHGFDSIYRGEIIYTARPGTIFNGPVYDDKGKVVKEGDILIKFDPTSRKQVIEFSKAKIMASEAALKYSEQKVERYKEAYEKKAIKIATLQKTEADYLKAKADLKELKHRLWMDYYMLEIGTYRASFDGIVKKVMMPSGWVAGELAIMEVAQLIPMGIKVEMKREYVNQITPATIVRVYPPLGDEPIGVDHNSRRLDKNGVTFFVNNYSRNIKYFSNIKDRMKMPLIDSIHTIFLLDQNIPNSPISVCTKSIHKDEKGKFVWKALGQNNFSINKGISSKFKVKKVYIETGDRVETVEPGLDLISLKDNKLLKPTDVVLDENVPKDLKDGQIVYYNPKRYIFMPGDPVKVEIGGSPK
jgi:hypothetical protein